MAKLTQAQKEFWYPGTIPIILTSNVKEYDKELAEDKFNFAKSFAWKYSSCNTWADKLFKEGEEKNKAIDKCKIDVCIVGCTGLNINAKESSECVAKCRENKLYKNNCEWYLERNLSNEQLVALNCAQELQARILEDKAKDDANKKTQTKEKLKKIFIVIFMLIIIYLIITY